MDITLPSTDLQAALSHPMVAALLDRMNEGAIVISAEDRKVVALNRRARSLLGFGDGPVDHCACKELMNSPLCRTACVLSDALEGADVTPRDTFYQGPDGDRLVHARTSVMVVRGPDGAPLAGIELFSDLSELRQLERQLGLRRSFQGIIGGSPEMQQLYALIEQVAPYDLPVLVTGESGRFALPGIPVGTHELEVTYQFGEGILETQVYPLHIGKGGTVAPWFPVWVGLP